MERWAGKVAVVTGASGGIGAAIAKNFAENKIIVVALARRLNKLEELAASSSGKIHPRACDLTKEEDILAAFRWVEQTLGGVDILVNNAALCKLESLIDGQTHKWREMITTNIEALNICTREALKTMRKRGDCGHIFHINSIAGHFVPAFHAMPFGLYSATKHAVTALTEALRIELQAVKSNIKITSVSPGAVKTDMLLALVDTATDIISKPESSSQGNEEDEGYLYPEDIADIVAYALSTKPRVQIHEVLVQPLGQKLG